LKITRAAGGQVWAKIGIFPEEIANCAARISASEFHHGDTEEAERQDY
jgi:hypothetical protein